MSETGGKKERKKKGKGEWRKEVGGGARRMEGGAGRVAQKEEKLWFLIWSPGPHLSGSLDSSR